MQKFSDSFLLQSRKTSDLKVFLKQRAKTKLSCDKKSLFGKSVEKKFSLPFFHLFFFTF